MSGNDIKTIKVGEFTITTTSNNPIKTTTDENGYTIFEGKDFKVKTEANTASKVILKGDGITFEDGAETKGSLADDIKVFGDDNKISTAYKAKPATGDKNGDNIFLKGRNNEIDLRSGNKLRIEGLSWGNDISMTQASDVSNASNGIFLNSKNNVYIKSSDGIQKHPSSLGVGSEATLNVHLEKNTRVTCRKPGRDNESGSYKIIKAGEEQPQFISYDSYDNYESYKTIEN